MDSDRFIEQVDHDLPPAAIIPEQEFFPLDDDDTRDMSPFPTDFDQTYNALYPQHPLNESEPINTLGDVAFKGALLHAFPNATRPLGQLSPKHIQFAGFDFLREQLMRPQMPDHEGLVDLTGDQATIAHQEGTGYPDFSDDSYNSGYDADEISQFQHRGDQYQPQVYADYSLPQEMIAAGASHYVAYSDSPTYHPVSPPQTFEDDTNAAQMQATFDSSPPDASSAPDAAGLSTSDPSFQLSSSPPVVNTRKKAKPRSRRQAASSDSVTPPTAAQRPAAPPIGPNGLRYPSLAAALAAAEYRTKPDIEEDDWEEMEADPAAHVLRIISAFSGQTVDCPHRATLSSVDQERWNTFQNVHLQKVAVYHGKDETKLEQSAWMVFGSVIEAHKRGFKNPKKIAGAMKCSDHLNDIIETISDYAIVRWDVIRHQRIEELVTSTQASITRKLANWNNNLHKRERDEDNAAKATMAGFDYSRVLGSKRKPTGAAKQSRKRKQAPAADDEVPSPETEESLEAPAAKRRRSTKSQAAATLATSSVEHAAPMPVTATATATATAPAAAPKRSRITKSSKAAPKHPKRDPRKTVVAGPDT